VSLEEVPVEFANPSECYQGNCHLPKGDSAYIGISQRTFPLDRTWTKCKVNSCIDEMTIFYYSWVDKFPDFGSAESGKIEYSTLGEEVPILAPSAQETSVLKKDPKAGPNSCVDLV